MVAIETKNIKKYLEEYGFLPETFAAEFNISVEKATDILQAVSDGKIDDNHLIVLD